MSNVDDLAARIERKCRERALNNRAIKDYFKRFGHQHGPGYLVTAVVWAMPDGAQWVTIAHPHTTEADRSFLAVYRVGADDALYFDGEGDAIRMTRMAAHS